MIPVGFAVPAMALCINPARPVTVIDLRGNGEKYGGTQEHSDKQINDFSQFGLLIKEGIYGTYFTSSWMQKSTE